MFALKHFFYIFTLIVLMKDTLITYQLNNLSTGSGKSSGTADEKSKSERGLQEELTLLKDKHGVLEKEKQQLLRQLQELREVCMKRGKYHSVID